MKVGVDMSIHVDVVAVVGLANAEVDQRLNENNSNLSEEQKTLNI